MVAVGQTLLGRYRLEEVIGVGGMGTVMRAHDSVLDRTVAVKVLKDELASDEGTLQRFQREARIVASLSDPGIAHVFDFAEHDGSSFIVMELLDGEDLHQLLAREKTIEPVAAASIAASVAEALQHAHERGAIHRDIKPGNIFMTRSGGIKVTDFGVAWAASHAPVTRTGDVVGTPHYLAPELVAGGKATPSSDIYALGCVLFQMITGSPPFEADSSVAVAVAHRDEPAPDLAEEAQNVPPNIAKAVSVAMAKDPSERYASASSFSAALLQEADISSGPATVISSGGPETMVIPAIAERVPEIARKVRSFKRPLIAIAAAIVVLLLLWVASTSIERSEGEAKLPNFVGMSTDAAKSKADDLGLEVETKSQLSAAAQGQVIGQQPAAGGSVGSGAKVVLDISDGNGVAVPSVTGASAEEASERLTAAGLKAKIVDAEGDAGLVVSQNPVAGAIVARGSEVEIGVPSEEEKGKRRGKGNDD